MSSMDRMGRNLGESGGQGSAKAGSGAGIDPERQKKLLFMMLVQQNQQIALMGLGAAGDPETGESRHDPAAARFAVDTLAMLREYTGERLPAELAEYLDTVLSDLRARLGELDVQAGGREGGLSGGGRHG